jgi:hypothetical protein
MSTEAQRAAWREQKRAWVAKAKAKREAAPTAHRVNGAQHDAIVYLRHAEAAINADIRSGRVKKLGKAALLTLLALSALQGGGP